MPLRTFRVVVDIEIDTDSCDDPSTWAWNTFFDAPTALVTVDEVAPVPTEVARRLH